MKRIIKNVFHNIKYLLQDPSFLTTRKAQPRLKRNGLCLHLGCGDVDVKGWINIDARDANHVHLVDLDLKLSKFKDNSISCIYTCHVLEHFAMNDAFQILSLFKSKLEEDGILYISVPDFAKISGQYQLTKSIESISSQLLGGQDYEFNFHKSIYDNQSLTTQLKNAGFYNIKKWAPTEVFQSSNIDFANHPVSLNLVAQSK